MKIAFLSFYSGQIDRGVEVAVEALARHLSQNHSVSVFQAGKRVGFPHTHIIPVEVKWPADSSGSWLRFLYLDYFSFRIAQFTLRFLPYLAREKYDVLIPTNGGWQVLLCRIAAWLMGAKLLVQGNAGIGRDDFWSLLCFPDIFIAISPVGLKWAQKKAPWVKSIYIPYGVEIELFEKAKPARVPLQKPIVLCVSAFVPYKQVDLLIRAMKHVSHASLLVIGQGTEEANLRESGRKLLGKRFLLKTGISHDLLHSFYKAAAVFSLPSRSSEALGIVQIEAMAANIPVVATDDSNRREIIGDAGILIDPTDEKAYVQGLETALKTDFGNRPRKQAEQFAWKTIAKQYEQILNNIDSGSSPE